MSETNEELIAKLRRFDLGGPFKSAGEARSIYARAADALEALVSRPVEETGDWEYMRQVGGFGWPQGYPQPCGADEKPTHRRTKAIPAGPWVPVVPTQEHPEAPENTRTESEGLTMTITTPQQLDPNSATAAEIEHLFGIMGESQRKWQDAIGFGEEGHELRAYHEMRTQALATQIAMHPDDDNHLTREYTNLTKKTGAALRNYYMAKLGLIMTEASEAFDEMRKHEIGERYYSTDDQGQQKPEGVLSELADVVIRVWSLTGETGLSSDLADAIVEKLNYNATRSERHGGKAI